VRPNSTKISPRHTDQGKLISERNHLYFGIQRGAMKRKAGLSPCWPAPDRERQCPGQAYFSTTSIALAESLVLSRCNFDYRQAAQSTSQFWINALCLGCELKSIWRMAMRIWHIVVVL
jgi:hypothetical protein